MRNPLWRLCNLYFIRSRKGGPIQFRPTPEQRAVIRAIYVLGWRFIIITKPRQIGMSTILALICLDAMLFGSGMQISWVDQTATDAKKKLEEKVKFAFNHLPEKIRNKYVVDPNNEKSFGVRLKRKGSSGSVMYAGDRARGGTNQVLVVSEWGFIQLKDKARSEEILTGALPSAEVGLKVVETTWRGGRVGHLWGLVSDAENTPAEEKTAHDPRVMFFPWHNEPRYTVPTAVPGQINEETAKYFRELERELGKKFTTGQKVWWQKAKKKYHVFMGREYPSTPRECYDSPTEGAFFDAAGVTFQANLAIEYDTRWKYGNIVVNGTSAHWVDQEKDKGHFARMEEPREGESYICPADFSGRRLVATAKGERDRNAYGIIRAAKPTGEHGKAGRRAQVVCLCRNADTLPTSVVMDRIRAMTLLYGDCMCVPEANNKDEMPERLEAMGVKVWYQTTGADGAAVGTGKTDRVLGWATTSGPGGTRKRILDNLERVIREQEILIGVDWISHQLSVFVTNEKGLTAAAEGEHDDAVMMLAIGMFCIGSATPYMERRNEAVAAGPLMPWADESNEDLGEGAWAA